MEQLPNEILLQLLRQQSPGQLMKLRAVCRRWRDLVLDERLWAHRTCSTLMPDLEEATFAAQVLRLVPCLKRLELCDGRCEFSPTLEELARTTPCAAKELDLAVFHGSHNTVLAEDVLRNQVAHGRLRTVRVKALCLPSEAETVLEILSALHLDELDFHVKLPDDVTFDLVPAYEGRWGSGSVSRLTYCGKTGDALLRFLLRARADSIEYLDVILPDHLLSVPSLALVGGCRGLREARLPAVAELSYLQQCPSLVALELSLRCDSSQEGNLPGLSAALKSFFRGATALQRLKFGFWESSKPSGVFDLVLDWVDDLASSGESRLEELSITKMHSSWTLRRLGTSLPGLRLLRRLTLGNVLPEELRAAINPASVPSLQLLEVKGGLISCVAIKPNDIASMFDMVRKNPRMHVTMGCGNFCLCVQHHLGFEYPGSPRPSLGFCGHSYLAEQCVKADGDKSIHWLNV